MSEFVVVKSKIKEIEPEMNFSGDFADALNEEVIKLIKKAAERARANGRKTVMPKDL